MSDPERLIHRSGVVGALLQSARDDGPTSDARARAAKALGVAVAVHVASTSAAPLASSAGAGAVGSHAAGASAGAAASGAAGGAGVGIGTAAAGVAKGSFLATMTGKVVVGLAATALVTSAAVVQRQRAEAPPSLPVPPAATQHAPAGEPPPPPPRREVSAEPAVVAPSAASPPATLGPAIAPAGKEGERAAKSGPAASEPSLAGEVRAMELARAALASGDAILALERASAYRTAHPAGALTREARMIELEAHAALGHASEVKRLGEAMLRDEPNGPQSRRVRTLLADGGRQHL